MRPVAIDLFCGLSGWGAGLIDAGFRVIGYDIEDMFAVLGEPKPDHFDLVLQDVRAIHGSAFKEAALIVSSSPCTEYSYMAMPWTRAKQIAAALRGETGFPEGYRGSRTLAQLNELFEAQFRIQREASEAAGRHIPMVVENVRGAEAWVGKAAWNFGSYYLWGDLPALMPAVIGGRKVPGFRFDGSGASFQTASVEEGRKHHGDWFRDPDCPTRQGGLIKEGRKGPRGAWFNDDRTAVNRLSTTGSRSKSRKVASAKIAKIPMALSSHIGRVYYPRETGRA